MSQSKPPDGPAQPGQPAEQPNSNSAPTGATPAPTVQDIKSMSKADMREFFVRKVLEMNPGLKGARTEAEFASELKASAKVSKQSGVNPERFKSVLEEMLDHIDAEYRKRQTEQAREDEKLQEVQRAEHKMYFEDIVSFLVDAQVGGLSPEVREVLRQHRTFLQAIGTDLETISGAVKLRKVRKPEQS